LRWPGGDFRTKITTAEIREARLCGYTITCIEGYVFPRTEDMFSKFVNLCEQLRLHSDIGMAEVTKILQNSVYGKFGTHPLSMTYAFGPASLAGQYPLPESDEYHAEIEEIDEAYMQPFIAAWITAQARLMLTRTIYAVGPESVVYGDTDSIVCQKVAYEAAAARGDVKIGKLYGEWKVEKEYEWFQAAGPKNYSGDLVERDKKGNIIHVDKAKGMPRDVVDHNAHLEAMAGINNPQVHYRSVTHLAALLKRKEAEYYTMRKRSYSTLEHSLGWKQFPDGHVESVTVHTKEFHRRGKRIPIFIIENMQRYQEQMARIQLR